MGDDFDHEAVWIEEVGRVAVGSVLRERFWGADNLVSAIARPFVDAVHIRTGGNEEGKVLEPDIVP